MATTNPPNEMTHQKARNFMVFSALRAALGILWILLAVSVWSSGFAEHLNHYNEHAFQHSTGWLMPWFGTWVSLVTPIPGLWLFLARVLTTLIAIFLLLGFARKTTYILGIICALPLWTLMEGYNSDFSFGSLSLGTAIGYILFFFTLLLVNYTNGTTPHSLDFYIRKKYPWWRHISETTIKNLPNEESLSLPWIERIPIVFAIAGILALLVGGSFVGGHVGPIQIGTQKQSSARLVGSISKDPVKEARDATLPPLLGTGSSVDLNMVSTNETIEIASGIKFAGWTFNKTAPGPTIHVRQGQTVNVTFTNNGDMLHSIDFHSAMIAPSKAYVEVPPKESVKFSFEAKVPGVFIYHCGTPPVTQHMANGMYGAMIVDPIVPLPPADASYVFVQGEWYTMPGQGGVLEGDLTKMQTKLPDLLSFNGVAFQYRDHPIQVKVGKRIRIYFVNAGPNLWSAFHVIGGIFEKVYTSGDAKEAFSGISTHTVAPGEGDVFDIVFPEPGKYPFVDHSMVSMEVGAMGIFEAK